MTGNELPGRGTGLPQSHNQGPSKRLALWEAVDGWILSGVGDRFRRPWTTPHLCLAVLVTWLGSDAVSDRHRGRIASRTGYVHAQCFLSSPEVLGEVAIANLTPYDDPASYVVAVVGADGDLRNVHMVSGHKRVDGWQALVSAALSARTIDPSEEAADLAVAAAELLRSGSRDRGINRDG
jgi:hypothetical protein